MKRFLYGAALLLALCLTGCGTVPAQPATATTTAMANAMTATATQPSPAQSTLPGDSSAAAEPETETQGREDMIKLTVGKFVLTARLADTPAARELAALLRDGPITMSASNYGGFEKVCSLGTRLTAADVDTVTEPGDIMLYNGNKIVIFYGSNAWAYTRLARVAEEDIPLLREALSGSETEVVIALADN